MDFYVPREGLLGVRRTLSACYCERRCEKKWVETIAADEETRKGGFVAIQHDWRPIPVFLLPFLDRFSQIGHSERARGGLYSDCFSSNTTADGERDK